MNAFVFKLSRVCAFAFTTLLLHFSLMHAQPLPERVPLAGKVTTTTGTPIGGAIITLQRRDPETVAAFWGGQVRTDATGTFSFPEAEEGTYSFSVEAAGYAGHQGTLPWALASTPPQTKLLKLTPLPLRVLTVDGKPLEGGRVQLHHRGEPPAKLGFPVLVANAEGKVVAPDLVPARYWIHAVVPGKGYAILPSLEVRENDATQVDVQLRQGGKVRAIAKTEDGRAIGGAALSLSEALPDDAAARDAGKIVFGNDGSIYLYSQDRSTLLTRDGEGAMELLDVAPGRYQARLFLPGEPGPAAQTIEVKAGETVEIVAAFKLRRTTASLEVAVQTPAGQPAPNREFLVRLQPLVNGQPAPLGEAGPPLPPDAPPTVANLFQGVLTRRIRTDGNGKATLFPLRAGAWRVTLVDPEKPKQPPQELPTGDVTISGQSGTLTLKMKT